MSIERRLKWTPNRTREALNPSGSILEEKQVSFLEKLLVATMKIHISSIITLFCCCTDDRGYFTFREDNLLSVFSFEGVGQPRTFGFSST